MTTTGWIADDEPQGPAMPLTEFLMSRRAAPGAGGTLADVQQFALARGRAEDAAEQRWRDAVAVDPDERAANLIAGGYAPGMTFQLSLRLADVESELAAEREKLEKSARRQAILARRQAAGQLSVSDVMRMSDSVADEGDEGRVRMLERRRDSLRAQMAQAAELMRTPEDRRQDAVEQASRHARQVLAEVTAQLRAEDEDEARARAQLRADRAAFYAARGRRPFDSPGGEAEDALPPAGGQETTRGNIVRATAPGSVAYCGTCGEVPEFCVCGTGLAR